MKSLEAITNRKSFGRIIRKNREARILSQEKLSEELGMTREWLSRIECGKSSPNYLDTLKLIRAADFKSIEELNKFLDEAIPNTPVYTN